MLNFALRSWRSGSGKRGSTLQGPDNEHSQNRIEELQYQVKQKEQEEKKAREQAIRLSAQIRKMDKEGGTSLDPHKAGKFWQQMALGLIKGAMEGYHDHKKDGAQRELYEAEAEMNKARLEKESLEAELDQERKRLREETQENGPGV